MKGIIKSRTFWIGVVAGTVAGPVVLGKVLPSLRTKLPG